MTTEMSGRPGPTGGSDVDGYATMVARSLLHPMMSAATQRAAAQGFRKYAALAAPVDWTKYYTCARPFEQQQAMVKFAPQEWLRGLPDFLKLAFSDYLEIRGDPDPIPGEMIQSWFTEFFRAERALASGRRAG